MGFNLEIIKKSLNESWAVYRWFKELVLKTEVKRKLENNPDIHKIYQKLNFLVITEKIILSIIILFCLLSAIKHKPLYLLIIFILLCFCALLIMIKKKLILHISFFLIDKDFKNSRTENTLYQISEYYAKTYTTQSLVDILFSLNKISLLAVFFGIFFIRFLGINREWIVNAGLLTIVYWAVYAIVNFSVIYQRLK